MLFIGVWKQGQATLSSPEDREYGAIFPGFVASIEEQLPESIVFDAWFDAEKLYPLRIVITFNLAEKHAELAAIDTKLIEHNKARWSVLSSKTVVSC